MIPTLLLLACTAGEAPPAAEAPAAEAPAAEAPPAEAPAAEAPAAAAPAAAGGSAAEAPAAPWTAATIAGLQPVAPTHDAAVPSPIPATPAIEAALQALGAVVDARATDPANPWAIGHGLVARGPDLVLSNGQPAVEWLFAEYGEVYTVDGAALLRFPESRGEVRVEPHADLLLKAMTEVGVAPDRPVRVQGRAFTVADLWRGSLLRSYLVPATNHSRYKSPDDVAWSLQGLAAWAPPGLAWQAADGTPMTLEDLSQFGLAVLFKETRFLADSLRSGQPFRRQGQGVFRYTCGGAHLLQGVGLAVARGYGGQQGRQVLAEQGVLMLHRFPGEAAITRQAYEAMPEHRDQLAVQRLKFAGHYLESMSKLQAWGLWQPRPADLAVLQAAAEEVVTATGLLRERGLLDDLDAVRARDEQLYLDLVGDSAHAVAGLELALGRRTTRW